MSSSVGNKGQSNQNSKDDEDHAPRSFCEHLCYLLPCIRRRGSPASSQASSKNSKHNLFLENHYIIKCPKKKCFFKRNDKKKEVLNHIPRTREVNQSLNFEPKTNHKEVRFLGAAKKCDRNYLKLLGMEPNDYLNQFSSVFLKNLKSPIPKDPCNLPKKYNVYIPPKKKSNRSIASLSRITDVRNFLQFNKHGQPFSDKHYVPSIVKGKRSSFHKKSDSVKEETDQPKDVFYDAVSPNHAKSLEKLENIVLNKNKNLESEISKPEPPWECSGKFLHRTDHNHRYRGLKKKHTGSKTKIKEINPVFDGNPQIANKQKSDEGHGEKYVKRIKNYIHLNEESKKQENGGAKESPTIKCSSSIGSARSEDSDKDPHTLDRNPWPNKDIFQLHAEINNNHAFRRDALRKHRKHTKTLVWKLIIKNQKEYIKS